MPDESTELRALKRAEEAYLEARGWVMDCSGLWHGPRCKGGEWVIRSVALNNQRVQDEPDFWKGTPAFYGLPTTEAGT